MNPQKAAKFILPSFRRKPESSATIRLPFSDRNYSLRLLVPLRSINHSASGKGAAPRWRRAECKPGRPAATFPIPARTFIPAGGSPRMGRQSKTASCRLCVIAAGGPRRPVDIRRNALSTSTTPITPRDHRAGWVRHARLAEGCECRSWWWPGRYVPAGLEWCGCRCRVGAGGWQPEHTSKSLTRHSSGQRDRCR